MSINLIISEARSWVGTAFHHCGRVRKSAAHKGGCDCLGLVMAVAAKCKILSRYYYEQGNIVYLSNLDPLYYPRIPESGVLQNELVKHCVEKEISQVQPGDILLFAFDNNPQHLAIVSDVQDDVTIIHAYLQARKVVEHRVDPNWQVVGCYGFFERL